MMEVKYLKDEDNYLEVQLTGEEHTFPNMLRDILMEDKDVTFAAYVLDHPLVGQPKIIIRTKKGDPKKALKAAVKELKDRLKKFESAISKK
ncbi:DNA-directed RNA polymerase subunit L [Candidatus Gugararchaeum adminiculabundum]|nr:DNA-directed RNA polymerase subunit L [Candidatus Gugararchaeum adminiculabundum]